MNLLQIFLLWENPIFEILYWIIYVLNSGRFSKCKVYAGYSEGIQMQQVKKYLNNPAAPCQSHAGNKISGV